MLPDGNDPPYPVLQTVANPSQLKKLGTDSEIQTHTERVLKPLPLPKLGYIGISKFGPAGGI